MTDPKKPRTGAQRAADRRPAPKAAPTPPPPRGPATATHRGIRWQRQPSGLVRWWDRDAKRWVPYRRGDDAPPRPPGWEPERRAGGPATDKAARKPWTSPYRLVPLAIFIVILAVGFFALRRSPTDQAKAEAQATAKLAGRCLAQDGTSDGHPKYSPTPVACSAPGASVKVVQVLAGTPGSPGCAAGETGFSEPYAGVAYPHVLCTAPVTHAR